MALTSTEVADYLGLTTASGSYSRIVALLGPITYSINEYTNGAFSHQVKEEAVTFSGAGTSNSTSLDHDYIIRGTVYVSSTDRGTVYYGDDWNTEIPVPTYKIPSTEIEEYRLDYENGDIWATSTEGNLIPSTNALVTYSYIDLVEGGKVAASKMIQQQITMTAGIGSESVGALSRSYVGGYGMDASVKAVLKPYCRIGWK